MILELSVISLIVAIVSVLMFALSCRVHRGLSIFFACLAGVFQIIFIAFGMYEGVELITLVTTTVVMLIVEYVIWTLATRSTGTAVTHDKLSDDQQSDDVTIDNDEDAKEGE